MPENRIYFLTWNGKKEPNWWELGATGPAGTDTEMFYDVTEKGLGDLSKEEYLAADERQDVVEIWNDVFMEYLKNDGKVVGKLEQTNVDTGAGLERLTMALQKKDNIFDTDLFLPMMEVLPKSVDSRSERIVADHIRTSVFMIADGVTPSNTDRGYILRRLLRRAYIHARKLKVETETLNAVIEVIVDHQSYRGIYAFHPETKKTIMEEIEKFKKALKAGLKQVEKGADPFTLFTSYGLPLEIIKEAIPSVDEDRFNREMEEHKKLSSVAGEKKFSN